MIFHRELFIVERQHFCQITSLCFTKSETSFSTGKHDPDRQQFPTPSAPWPSSWKVRTRYSLLMLFFFLLSPLVHMPSLDGKMSKRECKGEPSSNNSHRIKACRKEEISARPDRACNSLRKTTHLQREGTRICGRASV